ncbi:uncharacterized protein [Miscanthus floridulus]|uniref:uncharacterized protein n=1 Tax=Miscanthus floridulus TaxID=154761 RepID=UPI00345A776F
MSFRRRFVYLVMNNTQQRDFPLRRIDAARLFFPKGERPPVPPPPPEDARLPPPAIRFSAPTPTIGTGTSTSKGAMEFMLLHGSSGGGGGWRKRHKVVATDHTGRCVMYDPARGTVRALPELTPAPKVRPAALPVGDDDLYVIDTHFNRAFSRDAACFHGLLFDPDAADWDWRPMPPPPYARTYDPDSQRVRAHITSYAVAGGGGGASVWVSKDGLGTHSFDVGTGEWAKAGDWVLPFWGPGTYVPEHKLWFGLLADKVEDGVVCASDLTAAPPAAPRVLWREESPTPPEWQGRSTFLVHLGCSRFCLARFFKIVRGGPAGGSPCVSRFAVFSGLEVVTGGHGDGEGEELRMVKHRSLRYNLVNKLLHWVL